MVHVEKTLISNSAEVDRFVKRSTNEVKIWGWLARVVPLSVLVVLAVLHFFNEQYIIDSILEAALVLFIISCVIWWYWAIVKISTTMGHMHQTHLKFNDLTVEIKQLRHEVNTKLDSTY